LTKHVCAFAQVDSEVAAEFRFHFDQLVEEEHGCRDAEAHTAARRTIGTITNFRSSAAISAVFS
jgi:hypothetical protein